MKRIFDFFLSFFGLIILSPILFIFFILIFLQDFNYPFYIASRVGKNGIPFNMIKFRSMIVNANASGVDSTASDDKRITTIGRIVRKFKIDEIPQLFNVMIGEMSFVGPRPNVESETRMYSKEEQRILSVKPGITDFSSIVFSDEGDILEGSDDPDLKYNQIIRPWKSRLALLYIDNRTLMIDIKIIIWTVLGVFSKKYVLKNITNFLKSIKSDNLLIEVCKRVEEPMAFHPPGFNKIISKRT